MTQINKKNNILYIVSNQIELYITTQINKKIIYYILLAIKLSYTLRRKLIKKIYFFFHAKTLAMLIQMCYTIVTVRETEPNRAAAVKRTKGKTMENKVQLMSVNSVKKLNRKTLERNALDILTMGEIAMDFEDALAWVESASKYELIRFLIDNN